MQVHAEAAAAKNAEGTKRNDIHGLNFSAAHGKNVKKPFRILQTFSALRSFAHMKSTQATGRQAVVIGAGIAGIAMSIRLRLKGYEVQVFEANAFPGGKLSEIVLQGGYRFDAGPSLFTLPRQVEELFELAGRNPAAHFPYHRLETICRYFWEDGLQLDALADAAAFAREVHEKTGEAPEAVLRHLNKSREIYDITAHVFLERSLHRLRTFLYADTIRSIFRLHRIDAFRSMHGANKARFRDPHLVQLFDRYATYNGSDPYRAPATLNVIPHLEFNIGAFLPDRGLIDIPMSLYRLALELGVQYHFNSPVEAIEYEGRRVRGIRVNGESISAAVVASNMDVVPTYRRLLPGLKAPEKVLSQPRSSSALIFYWGMNRAYPQLDLHNIFFSDDYPGEFKHLWQARDLFHDPTVYVFISSKHIAGDAPEGHENWFVMVNAPADTGQDWESLIAGARKQIIAKLERVLGEPVESHIAAESTLDPRGIEQRTASYRGALYGSSSNSMLSAFLRHPNFHSKLKGLYFCGGSVHPGGGIPLSLLSARIAAEQAPDAPFT